MGTPDQFKESEEALYPGEHEYGKIYKDNSSQIQVRVAKNHNGTPKKYVRIGNSPDTLGRMAGFSEPS